MRRLLILFPALLATLAFSCLGATPSKSPDILEILDILKTNRPAGVSEADLNAAAVECLISTLGPKVSLIAADLAEDPAAKKPVSKIEMFDSSIGYLRIDRVNSYLSEAASEALQSLAKTNKLLGVALDLRYARGDDYSAVSAFCDLFLSKARPLLDWGNGMKSSTGKGVTAGAPVAVLVNDQTKGAPEAVAAVLRDAGAGLIFGSQTAGGAAAPTDFKLSTGQTLRVAARPIEMGSGSKLSGKVKPDIEIEVSAEDERTYYANAFAMIQRVGGIEASATNGTNRIVRHTRFNEADLVREHSLRSRGEGISIAGDKPADAPPVNDPALARALDVLKGLAVVRQPRSTP
jgi:hypothetical protein